MTNPKLIRVEQAETTISVGMARYVYSDGSDSHSDLRITNVFVTDTDLSVIEKREIVEQIMESQDGTDIVNALLDALAGKGTVL